MRTLNWRWVGAQVGGLALGVVVLYAVGVGGTLTGVVSFPLRVLTLVLLAGGGAVWLLTRRDGAPRFVPALIGLCAATALTTVFSSDPRRSLIYLGYFCAVTLAYWMVADRVTDDESRLESALLAALGLLVLLSLEEIRRHAVTVGWLAVLTLLRPSSLMGSSNVYGTLLLAAWPLVARRAVSASSWPVRGLWALWLLVLAGLLFMVASRAVWLGAALGGVVFVGLALSGREVLRPTRRARRVALAALGLLSAVAVALALPTIVKRATDASHGTVSQRVEMWQVAAWQFGRKPLTGRGPFTYADVYTERLSTPPDQPHAHAHNLILNVAAEMGLPGLAALGWLGLTAWGAVREGLRADRLAGAAAAALLAGVVTHSLFDVTLVPGVALLVLWALAALVPGRVDAVLPGVGAATGRWVAGLLWLATVCLLAFPLPAAQAAARAADAIDQEEWAAAAAQYEVAIRRDPALTAYTFDAAFVNAQLALQGDDEALERAIELYRAGLARRPEYALHWANLAVLEYRAGFSDAALEDIHRAVERAPEAPVFGELAAIMARGGDLSTAPMPQVEGFGEGVPYSLNRFHVPTPGLALLPLPEGGDAQ